MSLLSITSGGRFSADSGIMTGAGTFTVLAPPSGERLLVSDILLSAQDAGVYEILIGSAVKRHVFLGANGGWVENKTLPLEGNADESIQLKIITASASAILYVEGEYSK